eukprot:scaffold65795_cov60-Phaeocystis_antarctica.AAC.1
MWRHHLARENRPDPGELTGRVRPRGQNSRSGETRAARHGLEAERATGQAASAAAGRPSGSPSALRSAWPWPCPWPPPPPQARHLQPS